MENSVSLDLMEFIEKNILPRYSEFDKAHNMEHVTLDFQDRVLSIILQAERFL